MFEIGMMRAENPQLVELQGKIETALVEARQINVYDQETLASASQFVKGFASIDKRLEEIRKVTVAPLNQEVKDINQFFKDLVFSFSSEQKRLEQQILTYNKMLQEEAEAEAREERKRREEIAMRDAIEKEAKLKAEAAAKGEDPNKVQVEVAIIPEVIEQAPTIKEMNSSGIGTMKVGKWEVVDRDLIPREYFLLDEKKINQIRKAAGATNCVSTIPGIRFFFEDTLVKR